MTMATPRTTPCKRWSDILTSNGAAGLTCSVGLSVKKRAQAEYEMTAFGAKGRYQKLAVVVHVLQNK